MKRSLLVFTLLLILGSVGISFLPETYRARSEMNVASLPGSTSSELALSHDFLDEALSALLLQIRTPQNIKAALDEAVAAGELDNDQVDEWVERLANINERSIYLLFEYGYKELEGYWVPIRVVTRYYLVTDASHPAVAAYVANGLGKLLFAAYQDKQLLSATQWSDLLAKREQALLARLADLQGRRIGLERDKYAELPIAGVSAQNRLAKLSTEEERVRLSLAVNERLLNRLEQLERSWGASTAPPDVQAVNAIIRGTAQRLTEMSDRYSQDHPDLAAAQGLLEGLLQSTPQTDLSSAMASPDAERSLQRALYTLRASLAQTRVFLDQITAAIETERQSIRGDDSLGQGYRQSLLEESLLRKELAEIKQMVFMAELAVTLKETGVEPERLIPGSEASVAKSPLYPNKFAWFVLVFYLALLAAVWTYRKQQVARVASISSVSDLRAAVGDSVIGVCPTIL